MAESTFSQRYADGDDNTAGAFAFDTISAVEYAISKVAFGDADSVTRVTSSAGLPVAQQGTWAVDLGATDNAVLDAIAASLAGTLTVGSHAVTNAGTFAVQVTGDGLTALQSIDTKTPALGQALAAGSVPVVLTASQLTTLTPPAAITGFATAANQTTLIGHIDGIEGALTTIAGNQLADGHNVTIDNASLAVTGTFWQETQPVSLASVPSHAVTNAGTFAVQVSSALPAGTNNIGDVDVATQPARAATTDTITAKLATDTIQNGTTALTPKFAAIAASSSGNNTLVAAVVGKKIRVLAYNLIGNGAVNAKFQTGAGGTDLTGLKYVAAAGGGICAPFNPVGWFETASNALLNLNLSGAVAVGGELVYVEV